MLTLTTNQTFTARVVLKGLVNSGEQFTISNNAVIRVRVKSEDGLTEYTPWVVLPYNQSGEDNRPLSTIGVKLSASNTADIKAGVGKLDINVVGAYVDRLGADTADTYDETWTNRVKVEIGLA